MIFKEMNDNQRRIFIDTTQIYDVFMRTFHKNMTYKGGMHWKKSKGREYLFRSYDRYGYGKSLGVRSPETESVFAEFHKNKQHLKERTLKLKESLKEQARFCKAAMIQRVPRLVTSILRILEQQNILGKNVTVIGTNAIYAYEARAGIFSDSSLTATKDMDILWDTRTRLKLFVDQETDSAGLIHILKKADRSFEPVHPKSFRAANQDGYMVDLIKPAPKQIFRQERKTMGNKGDLEAVEILNLQWLISSPKFHQTVIGEDGYPALMVTHDPRAFVLHKLWLSQQPNREPLKKHRDKNQSFMIAYLILRYLPQYVFDSSELLMFPKELVESAKHDIFDSELPDDIK